jgi:hypothetical protein
LCAGSSNEREKSKRLENQKHVGLKKDSGIEKWKMKWKGLGKLCF